MKIWVHMKERDVTVLGPGRRYVLWVQGCGRKCPGCVAPESHRMEDGSPQESGALALEILLSGMDGLTISGGEPFLQAEALSHMLEQIRREKDMGVIVYTGYTLEELQARRDPCTSRFLGMIDLLIDGPYIQELDDNKSLRGSSNQRVIPLTPRYAEIANQIYGQEGREVSRVVRGIETRYIGVPSAEALQEIRQGRRGGNDKNTGGI